MAYHQCRFCPIRVKGTAKLMAHERWEHPFQYFQPKAEECRRKAQQFIAEAEQYERLANRPKASY